jgi:hypothetical protein
MFHPTRPLRGVLAAAGLALLAGACTDELVAPRAAPHAAASHSTSAAGRPAFIRNTVRYRDTGAQPSTGRSGGATLTARALLGKGGATELEVSAGLADGAAGTATLEKLQVKHVAPDGRLIRTLNHNAVTGGTRETVAYTGLERGSLVRVQANVHVRPRTGVVTVTETVHLRPDLRAALDAPGQAPTGLPVNISAVISEGNGDVGARADCVLYVDGAEADRAEGIWVDAGGVVTCAFAHTFTAAGTHTLRVEAANVDPGDFDTENNSAVGTLQVMAAVNDFGYHAWAQDTYDHSVSTASGRWQEGNPPYVFWDHTEEWTWDIHYQEAWLYAWIPTGISLPITRIDVSGTTGGTRLHEASYTGMSGTNVPGWESPECASRWNDAGTYLIVCTLGIADNGLTTLSYQRHAGDVTYHSRGEQLVWVNTPGDGYFYTFNFGDHYTFGDPIAAFGPDYTFAVALTDGARTWNANVTLVLSEPQTISYTAYPPTGEWCGVEYYAFDQVFRGCRTHRGVALTRRADVWGGPD